MTPLRARGALDQPTSVIQILTRRGMEGPPRFGVTVRHGATWFSNPAGRLNWWFFRNAAGQVDSILAESLTREIGTAEQRGADVNLADLTGFDWDHVLIADRKASRAQIERALGGPWKGKLAFGTGDLMIFVHNGHVARYADYRGAGRFAGVRRPVARFARDDAVFSVRSLVIRPKSSAAPSSP